MKKRLLRKKLFNNHLLLTNLQSNKLVMEARKIVQEEITTRFYCTETVFELLGKLKNRAFHFLADAGLFGSSDINQHRVGFFFFALVSLRLHLS